MNVRACPSAVVEELKRAQVDAVRKMGGNVVLHGLTYDEAQSEAVRLVNEEGRTLIHPFDDPLVIAGQDCRACDFAVGHAAGHMVGSHGTHATR